MRRPGLVAARRKHYPFYLEGSFMAEWQQKFSIGYFFVALILLFLLQNYLASPPTEIDRLQPV